MRNIHLYSSIVGLIIMINTRKHESMDIPPDKPFFGKKRKSDITSIGVSPGERVSLRSECINQLDKWHQLRERGVISNEQYEDLQKTILTDIKQFNSHLAS